MVVTGMPGTSTKLMSIIDATRMIVLHSFDRENHDDKFSDMV
jgi:hypothetical protein